MTNPFEVLGLDPSIEISDEDLESRYLALSRKGFASVIDLSAPTATADFGSSRLTVKAKPGTRIYVVPAGSGFMAQLWGGRAASRAVPESGELIYDPFPAGRWDLGIDRRGIFATTEITDEGASVTIE